MSETIIKGIELVEEQAEDIPVLFLHAIERTYRQGDEALHILNGAELAIWPGQSVALVAPSGAGKSTLLHIAGLLEHPDHGDVYIDGRATAIRPDAERTRIRRNEIGFVYQSHHLLPESGWSRGSSGISRLPIQPAGASPCCATLTPSGRIRAA